MGGKEESVVEWCRVTVVVGLALVVENGSVSGYSWHIGAARRPLTFPHLSPFLSLSLPLFFVCSVSFYRYAPSFSVSSFSPSFLFNSPGVSFCLVVSSSPQLHTRTHRDRLRARESTPLRRLLPLCVYSSGFDPACLRSLRPLDADVPLRSPPSMLSPSSVSPGCDFPSALPNSDVAVCYDLHSSRNKTSATVLRSRRR